jgi:hypothetical protein
VRRELALGIPLGQQQAGRIERKRIPSAKRIHPPDALVDSVEAVAGAEALRVELRLQVLTFACECLRLCLADLRST